MIEAGRRMDIPVEKVRKLKTISRNPPLRHGGKPIRLDQR